MEKEVEKEIEAIKAQIREMQDRYGNALQKIYAILRFVGEFEPVKEHLKDKFGVELWRDL